MPNPDGPIDGVSGGGGFVHLWSDGEVRSYWVSMDAEPLIYEPEPLVRITGIASTLEVLPAPDGEHTWLVQDGVGFGPTLVELVNLLGLKVTRLGSYEVEGSWQPVGTTTEGLVLTATKGNVRTLLIGNDGSVAGEFEGEALAVGWAGAAILRPDGSLVLTDARLSKTHEVANPGRGGWVSVGVQFAPATAPPIVTGAEDLLVGLVEESENPWMSPGELIVIDSTGSTQSIYQLTEGARVATWSRGGDWVALVEPNNVTLIPLPRGEPTEVGNVVPNDHWVISAG